MRAIGLLPYKDIVGTQTDPRLPGDTLDYVLMVDVYHELSQPQIILRNIAATLKPGGKLVLVEFRKEDLSVPIRPEHEMTVKDVEAELSAEGYVLDHLIETLPWQHMFFFRRHSDIHRVDEAAMLAHGVSSSPPHLRSCQGRCVNRQGC